MYTTTVNVKQTGVIIIAVSLQMGTELCPLFQSKFTGFSHKVIL